MGKGRSDPPDSPGVAALEAVPVSIRALVRRYGTKGDPLAWTVRQIPGGQRMIWRLLALSSDPDAARVLASHRRLDGKALAEVLEDAEMAPREFIGLVSRVAYDFNIALGQAIVATQYPQMMKASMKRALDPEATDERKIHLQASGYLPVGKGIQIGIANNNLTVPDDRPPAPGRPASFDRTARQVVRDLPPAREPAP